MGGTGGVVTSAGMVFAATMAAMLGSDLVVLAQMGSTIAIGLLLDTLIVRSTADAVDRDPAGPVDLVAASGLSAQGQSFVGSAAPKRPPGAGRRGHGACRCLRVSPLPPPVRRRVGGGGQTAQGR